MTEADVHKPNAFPDAQPMVSMH